MANERKSCSACGVQLWYLAHERTGNLAPIECAFSAIGNIEPDIEAGTYKIVPKGTGHSLNHFARCPGARSFSRQVRTNPAGDRR